MPRNFFQGAQLMFLIHAALVVLSIIVIALAYGWHVEAVARDEMEHRIAVLEGKSFSHDVAICTLSHAVPRQEPSRRNVTVEMLYPDPPAPER